VTIHAHRLVVSSRRQAAHATEPKTELKLMRRLAVYAYPPGGSWTKPQKLAQNSTSQGNYHTRRVAQYTVHYLQWKHMKATPLTWNPCSKNRILDVSLTQKLS